MTTDKKLPSEEDDPTGGPGDKLEAIRVSVQHEFHSSDIDEMLAEIEIGYLEPSRKLD